ncbi:MAG: leucine-rich repeat protein, partial [Treponema sp.]
KKYRFQLPTAAHQPSAFSFVSGVRSAAGGSNGPVPGSDYTVRQSDDSTLKVVYKKEFLRANEYGVHNLNPGIVLWNKEGRRFNEPFSFKIRANTPPPALEYQAIAKTADPDAAGKQYYVLCFRVKDMEKTAGTELLHKDIAALSVTAAGGAKTNVALTVSETDFTISDPNGCLLAADKIRKLEAGDVENGVIPDELPTEDWILRLKTDVEVKGGTKEYSLTLMDEKGLTSPEITISTTANRLEPVRLYHKTSEITETEESSPHLINTGSSAIAVSLQAQAQTGASITGTVERKTGSSWISVDDVSGTTTAAVILPDIASGENEALYKISLKASGSGYNDSKVKTFFVKLAREIIVTFSVEGGQGGSLKSAYNGTEQTASSTTESLTVHHGSTVDFTAQPAVGYEIEDWKVNGSSVNGTNLNYQLDNITQTKTVTVKFKQAAVTISSSDTNAWQKLKAAVETGTVPVIIINGIVQAQATNQQIMVKRPVIIKAGTGSPALDASNKCFIFDIWPSGDLTLENLALLNGARPTALQDGGGAIYCAGGTLTAKSITISNCAAQKGGGIYAKDSTISLSHNSKIEMCTATGTDKEGGAVYVENSTFTIKDGTKIASPSGPNKGDNDVYLKNGQKITIADSLTENDTIAYITPQSYTEGTVVVEGISPFTLPAHYAKKFLITPSSNANEGWSLDSSTTNQLKLKNYGAFTIASVASSNSVTLSWEENGSAKSETITTQPYNLKLSPYIANIKLEAQCASTTFLKEWTLTGGGTPPSGYTVTYPNSTNMKGKTITAVFAGRDTLPAGFELSDDGKTIEKYTGTQAIIDLNAMGLGFVEAIANDAFRTKNTGGNFIDNTTLKEVVLPDGLKTLGSYAFFNCKALKKITIPKDFTGGINEVFPGCTALEEYVITAGNPRYCLSTNGHLCSGKQNSSGSYDLTDLTLVSVVFKPSTHPTLNIQDSRIKEIQNMAAEFHTFNKIEILGLSALSKIEQFAFFQLGWGGYELTINTPTPPALPYQPNSVFSGATKIKVPSGSVNAYRTAWPGYTGIIEGY